MCGAAVPTSLIPAYISEPASPFIVGLLLPHINNQTARQPILEVYIFSRAIPQHLQINNPYNRQNGCRRLLYHRPLPHYRCLPHGHCQRHCLRSSSHHRSHRCLLRHHHLVPHLWPRRWTQKTYECRLIAPSHSPHPSHPSLAFDSR